MHRGEAHNGPGVPRSVDGSPPIASPAGLHRRRRSPSGETESTNDHARRSHRPSGHRRALLISSTAFVSLVGSMATWSGALRGDPEGAASGPPGVFVFDTGTTRLAGVPLISATPSTHVGMPQNRILSLLQPKLGRATLISSTICRQKLPVTVAKWNDLSLVFENKVFAMLVYNYQGWPVSQGVHPPLPPAGVALRPRIVTQFGAAIDDRASRIAALGPKLRGSARTFFAAGAFSNLIMTGRAGVTGAPASTYLVSEIQAATGNC